MNSPWRRSVFGVGVGVVVTAMLILSGCAEAPVPPQEPGTVAQEPGANPIPFNLPSPPGPTVSGTAAGTLRIPGAMIVSAGQVHDGSAPIADAGLMGVKVNGHVYLYHPELGDVQLSEETSDLAVQYSIYGGRPRTPATTLQVASATEPNPGSRYRKTETGMSVRRSTASPSDHYTFENTTVLWHAVVSKAEVQPTFFAPKSIFGMDWKNYEFYLERREERDVRIDRRDVELYRDLLRGSFSLATQVATPLSIARYHAAVMAGADPQVFVKMVPIVITEEIAKLLDELLGFLPLDQCLDIIVDPILAVAESHLIAMFTNEDHRIVSLADALIQSLPANATICAARVIAASSSGGSSEVFIEVVEKVMLLKWAANEVLAAYDSIVYDAYATVPGLPFFEGNWKVRDSAGPAVFFTVGSNELKLTFSCSADIRVFLPATCSEMVYTIGYAAQAMSDEAGVTTTSPVEWLLNTFGDPGGLCRVPPAALAAPSTLLPIPESTTIVLRRVDDDTLVAEIPATGWFQTGGVFTLTRVTSVPEPVLPPEEVPVCS